MGEGSGTWNRPAYPCLPGGAPLFAKEAPSPVATDEQAGDVPGGPAGGGCEHCLTLIGGSASSAAARQFVRQVLGGDTWPGDVEAAVLLASELVSNAAQHAGGGTELTVRVNGPMLRVEASDRSSRRPRLRVPDPLDDAGRGLLLVDVLSSDWGVRDRIDGGKTVWFELQG